MKNYKQILITVVSAFLIGLGGFLFSSFISNQLHEQKQDINIQHVNSKVIQVDSLQKVKNSGVNVRLDKISDNNAIEHKAIKKDVVEIKDDITDVKILLVQIKVKLDMWERNNNLANEH